MPHRTDLRRTPARPIGLLLMLGALAAPADGQAPLPTPKRDWAAAPAVVEVDTKAKQDIYAIGDIHGDYDRMINLLVAGKLIAPKPAGPTQAVWTGGDAILVCTGDLIDKDDHALGVIACFQSLQEQAESAGGQVIVTMGNHEAEFLADPTGANAGKDKGKDKDKDRGTDADKPKEAKDADFVKELTQAGITVEQVASGTDKLNVGKFLLAMPIAARVDDWFFCHAGNTQGLSIRDLAKAIEGGVDQSGYAATILSDKHSLVEARMHPHPWWSKKDEPVKPDKLRDAVAKLGGVNHLVFGHQPGDVEFDGKLAREQGTLKSFYDGLAFMIDAGMCKNIGYSQGFLLRVHKQQTEAEFIDPAGKSKTLWPKPKH